MTIDIGYAHLALPDGTELDFVDVPGHDRLVGNMLVGAGEIDAALLVVAADDGLRAQTHEHIDLLDALTSARARRHHEGRSRARSADGRGVRGGRRTARFHGARRGADRRRVGEPRATGSRSCGPRSWDSATACWPIQPGWRDPPGRCASPSTALPDQGPRDGRHGHAPRRVACAWRDPADRAGRRRRARPRGSRSTARRSRRSPAAAAPRSTLRAKPQAPCIVASSSRPTRTCTPRTGGSSCSPPRSRTGRASGSTSERPPRRRSSVEAVATRSSSRAAPLPPCCASMPRWPRRRVTASCCGGRQRPGLPWSAASSSIRDPPGASPGGGRPPNAWRPWPRPRRPAIARPSTPHGSSSTASIASERDVAPDVRDAASAAALDSSGAPRRHARRDAGPTLAAVRSAAARALRRQATRRAAADAAAAQPPSWTSWLPRAPRPRDGDRVRAPDHQPAAADPERARGDGPPRGCPRGPRAALRCAMPPPPPAAHPQRSASSSAAGRIVVLDEDLAYAMPTYRDLAAKALALAAREPLTPAAFRDATGTSRRYVHADPRGPRSTRHPPAHAGRPRAGSAGTGRRPRRT